MVEHIVELAEQGGHVSLWRGFMRVERKNEEGKPFHQDVPLDLLNAVLLTSPNSSISKNLLAELAERNIPLIVSGSNFHPVGIYLPHSAHGTMTEILHLQISTSLPLKKRLWQQLVRIKIAHQAEVLGALTDAQDECHAIRAMIQRVSSGDSTNREAHAARIYWKALMGVQFTRNSQASDANALLNYGYAVLRAATARAVCAAGLQSALGVFHSNKRNPFCLVDDLMEIYRPLVDAAVWRWVTHEKSAEVTVTAKRQLASLLKLDLSGERGITPLSLALQQVAISYRDSLMENKSQLRIAALPDLTVWRQAKV